MSKPTYQQLQTLSKRHGDAFYLVDIEAFLGNCQEFLKAFRVHYPRTHMGYSYKTNYLPAFCEAVEGLGEYAEVVSGMEYRLARHIGVEARNIIFNGPYKIPVDLALALQEGATINIDSLQEVEEVISLRKAHPSERPFRVCLRCHPGVPEAGETRFGIDAETGDLAKALKALRATPGILIRGVHCHVCPPKRRPDMYGVVAKKIVGLVKEHFDEPPECINLGGGFFSKMPPSLAARWPYPIPTYQAYGEAMATVMAEAFGEDGPELILEPGIALTADVIDFVCRVHALKHLAGKDIAIVTGSVYNTKPTKNNANLPMTSIRASEEGASATQAAHFTALDITGYTCMEDDVMYKDWSGELAVGDFLIFHNVGAYTNVLKPPFILPAPPMLLRSQPEVQLRRAERWTDVFATYKLANAPSLDRVALPNEEIDEH